MLSKKLFTIIFTLISYTVFAGPRQECPDCPKIAQLFRPYVKFSREPSRGDEQRRPCSWQWLYDHSKLMNGTRQVLSNNDLKNNHSRILDFADLNKKKDLSLNGYGIIAISDDFKFGEPWDAVKGGDGFYAHVTDLGHNLFNIEYWVLFAYNQTTVPGQDHDGDLISVHVVVLKTSNSQPHYEVVRVAYLIHGYVYEGFEFMGENSHYDVARLQIDGKDAQERYNITKQQQWAYATGWDSYALNSAHSPSHDTVYFIKDIETNQYTHPVIYLEWGAHEPWPNVTGGVISEPIHNGEGTSFLPDKVELLDDQIDGPFKWYGGVIGTDPKGIIRHRGWYKQPNLHPYETLPNSLLIDDPNPYQQLNQLAWPPNIYFDKIKMMKSIKAAGEIHESVYTVFDNNNIYKSPDGTYLGGQGSTECVYAGNTNVKDIVPLSDGRIITIFTTMGRDIALLSPDGRSLGGGTGSATVYAFGPDVVASIKYILPLDGGKVLTVFSNNHAYLSPDGTHLGGGGNTVQVYDGSRTLKNVVRYGNKLITVFNTNSEADGDLTYINDIGGLLAAGQHAYDAGGRIRFIMPLSDGHVLTVFSNNQAYLSPDGTHLGGGGNTVQVYDGSRTLKNVVQYQNKLITVFNTNSQADGDLTYINDIGGLLAAGQHAYDAGGRIKSIIPLRNNKVMTIFSNDRVYLSPDGTHLGGGGGTTLVYSNGDPIDNYVLYKNGIIASFIVNIGRICDYIYYSSDGTNLGTNRVYPNN